MILARLDYPKVFLHFPMQSVAAFKFWNTICNSFQWARCPFSARFFSHFFVFCLLFLALATIIKEWSTCSGCESIVCPKICFLSNKNNHNTKETKQNTKLKKRKKNMKKRRTNAIIRNKFFDDYGIKLAETFLPHFDECVTVLQMLSDYIIARFDRRGRIFVTLYIFRFDTISRILFEFFCFIKSENTAACLFSHFKHFLLFCVNVFFCFSHNCIRAHDDLLHSIVFNSIWK